MFESIILSVTLLANGDMQVIERPAQTSVPAVICLQSCDFTPSPVKKIYRARNGRIELLKEVHQVPVVKTDARIVMEWSE